MVRRLWMGTALAGLLAGGAAATQPTALAEATARGTAVDWTVLTPYQRAVLTVSTPDGAVVRSELGPGSAPTFSAFDEEGEARPDGSYNWELRLDPILPPDVGRRLETTLARRDEKAVRKIRRAHGLDRELVQSGTFVMSDGAFVAGEASGPDPQAPEAKLGSVREPVEVISDLIVRGRACVGQACVQGMSFPTAPFVVSATVPNLHFEDTSGPSSGHDWVFRVNGQPFGSSGNFFSLTDLYTATTPLTVTGGAPTNSILVDSTGRVGFRTSTPVGDIHVNTSNTPIIRLEQNSSGGWPAQTWDVAGNDAQFFVRDVTGSSRVPFRIHPGAPTSSFVISSNGFIGLGVATAANPIQHVNGAVLTAGGTWQSASSRASKRDIRPLEASDALATLQGLEPVRFYYKAEPGDEYVGFVAEDVPDLVATADHQRLGPLDIVAVLTKVVQQQQTGMNQQQATIDELAVRLRELEQRQTQQQR